MKQRSMPPEMDMYQALVEKNVDFEGIFIVGVKTTGIFCRPSCTARKPKRENVEFFSSTKEAAENGYRPCKICQPLELIGARPLWVEEAINLMNLHTKKITDQDLKKNNIEPIRLRRWFLKNHGMTFHQFQRSQLLSKAANKINHQQKVIDAALESGYGSVSGFGQAFKNITGLSPKSSTRFLPLIINQINTPLGNMIAGVIDDKLCLLEFEQQARITKQIKAIKRFIPTAQMLGQSEVINRLKIQLQEYFDGQRKLFTIPLLLLGTSFQKECWQSLQKIEYGKTRSYSQQALHLNKPAAVRAVASANAANRIAILIPCHRVISNTGKLAGYAGGLWRKQRLLELENALPSS